MSRQGISLSRLIRAAQGKRICDVVIKNVRFLDVFTCSWRQGDVGILDGIIVGIEAGLKGKRTFLGNGKALVPGFIDAHVHVESSLLVPQNFQRTVLPHGTTSIICDPHEIANVIGLNGIKFFLKEAGNLALDMRVLLSSCVPATKLETNGAGNISARDLQQFSSHPRVLGLAEMMDVSGVLGTKSEVLAKLQTFAGQKLDGHCPSIRGNALSACAVGGISSCHESTDLEEAREKISKGMSVWIREGSVARDLETLWPLLETAPSMSVGFCTDDRNPLDVALEGHIDFMIRKAIQSGAPPTVVYRCASWSVAKHYGLYRTGAIAPGYWANMVLLDDIDTCAISDVFVRGKRVAELKFQSSKTYRTKNTVLAAVPEETDLMGPNCLVNVIGVRPYQILTDHLKMEHDAPGVAKISILERYGKGLKPVNGYVHGFGENFHGALASSIAHDSHNLTVVGKNSSDMRIALRAIIEAGGGLCAVQNGKVLAQLALPFGGIMSLEASEKVVVALKKLRDASRAMGCILNEPFLQLAFLSLPVVPFLKITDRGLVDVQKSRFINVRAG
ncbi:MAG: adenine deaminase [Deltaproteobacteria bacterium]|nr:adenine deaminase [Deltaproteobacteria bacterium]